VHTLDHVLPEVSGYSIRSHNLLRALRIEGFDVVAVSSSSRESTAVEDEIDGVRYVHLPFRVQSEVQTPAVLWRRVAVFGRWLSNEVRRRRASLIHAHTPFLNVLPALWAARRRRLPLVYEVRAFWEDAVLDRDLRVEHDLRYRSSRALETWALHRVDAVTTISQGQLDEIIDRGVPRQRVHVVPNGVDSATFRPQEPDPELLTRHRLTGHFIVGYIGYFLAYEGVEILVRGFARMLQDTPRVRLLLVGTGPYEASLRSEAESLGIAANVVFTGAVPHAQIGRYYSICDVVVYPRPSRRTTELTTPLKPLEAMAMARPVIASSVGGLREVVRDGDTGMLFPAGDTERLGQLLAQIAMDAALRARLGANARRFVCDERSWEHSVQRYVELYDELWRSASAKERR
jgi:PEP-CTERM/exosortase A-associated glycosyltransferase